MFIPLFGACLPKTTAKAGTTAAPEQKNGHNWEITQHKTVLYVLKCRE